MKNRLLLFFAAVLLISFPKINYGQAPALGTTSGFALFTAVGAFSNTGATNVTGDLGTNVGAFSGFPPGTVLGQIHVADPVSAQAAIDVDVAYSNLGTVTCGAVIGTTLGNNQVLTPNVYCLGAASILNGDLTLDGQGDPNALFIFKIDGAFTTSTFTNVFLINAASLSNVYWQVNGQFVLGDGSIFRGTLVANGAITLLEGASLFGRGLSRGGAIALHNNVVNVSLLPIPSIITASGPTSFCIGGSVTLSGNLGGVWNTGSTAATITVSTGGDYFVTNTNAFGSVTSNHIVVTVNPLPAAIAGSSISICENASTQLGATAVTGSTYIWSAAPSGFTSTMANPTVSPTTTTIYTVTETDLNGCQHSNSVTIGMNAATTITSGPASQTACVGSSVSFSVIASGTGLTYQWYRGSTLLTDGGAISGVTTSMLSISPFSLSDIATDYNVVVSGSCLPIATSLNAALNNSALPTLTCPQNLSQATDPEVCSAVVNNISAIISGDCPSNSLSFSLSGATFASGTGTANGLNFNKGITLVTYTIADAGGQSSSCQFTVTIIDTVSPVIVAPQNLTVLNDPGNCFAGNVILGAATATDNCSGTILSNDAPVTFFKGLNTVIWTATDGSGNKGSSIQTIMVIDNEIPVIICPANVIANVNTDACEASGINLGNPQATDNCTGITLLNNAPLTYAVGTTTVTWTATDASGNSVSCDQLVMITDNIAPVIICLPTMTINTDPDQCTASNVFPGTPQSSDNCALASLTNNAPSIFGYGNTIVTWLATDASGNSSICTQMVIVVDNQPPDIICPVDITITGTNNVVIPAMIATDNCGIASITNSFTGNANASGIFPIGTTLINWLVTDVHGNTATCIQQVNVLCQLIALNDYVVLPANIPATTNVAANDLSCGAAANCNNITIVTPALHFTAVLSTTPGVFNIFPQAGFVGTDSLLYQSCCLLPDGSSICATAWLIVNILNPPTAYIMGNTTICLDGYATLLFTFTGQPPYSFQYTDGVQTFSISGIMSSYYTVEVQPLVSTNYSLVSITDASGLNGTTSGLASVIVNAIPYFIITGGGNFCPGSPGVIIGLSGSTPGTQYQLELNGNAVGSPLTGTGQALNFGNFNVPGNYYIKALNPDTYCNAMMYGAAQVNALPGPKVYTTTGGGECCFGCIDVFVGLDGSQQGVMYHVWLNNTLLHNIPGTGGILDFGLITQSGLYTVTATDVNGCTIEMDSYAVVTIHPRPEATLVYGNTTICAGDSTLLWFNTTAGTGPFSFTLSTGDSIIVVGDSICDPIPVYVHPMHTTTYTLLYVNDSFCVNYGSGTSIVNVIDCLPLPVYSISGHVNYQNVANSPMSNDMVYLKLDNQTVGSVSTNESGYYHFDNLTPGHYGLNVISSRPLGGVNAADALLIARHFTQLTSLTDLHLKAADVNANSYVNAADALLVAKRFVNLIETFPSGDWAFQAPSVNIMNTNAIADIPALCFGDVNGSFQPGTARYASTVNLITQGSLEIQSAGILEIPITTALNEKTAAISLVINYPAAMLEVMQVKISDQDQGTLVYKAENGILRIAWFNTNTLTMESSQSLLKISFMVKNPENFREDAIQLSLGNGSEITNTEGEIIPDIDLITPRLLIASSMENVSIYPNPSKGITQIVYSFPERCKITLSVCDILGKTVSTLVNENQESGQNTVTFNANSLPPGVYTVCLIYAGTTQTRTINKRLVITQ